jgi:uncharacterized protein (TIGR02996 family)
MTTEDDFQGWLDLHPDDHHCRAIFADWLDEQGDPRGPGYRALSRHCLFPSMSRLALSPAGCPYWFKRTFGPGEHFYLFEDWYDKLDMIGKGRYNCPDWTHYTGATRKECEDAAAFAFVQLPVERQEELLRVPALTGASG